MTALAIRDDQTQFDDFQIAVLRQSGVDEDVSNAELAAFLHTCQRRQLDPFAQQIYLIGRYDSQRQRKAYKPQTSIDGFRLIARRAADRSGVDYEYEDTVWFDAKGGRHEVWLGDGAPAAAKVVVVRNGRRFDAVARYSAYVQANNKGEPRGLWKTMPDTLIAKCAEALALRKAFPEDLGGLYTNDEMAQADNPASDGVVPGQVVREDRPGGANGNGGGRRSAPATDQAWLKDITTRITKLSGPKVKAGSQKLWTEINGKLKARQCSEGDGNNLRDLIVTKVQAAEAAGEPPPDDSDVVDGEIVARPGQVTDKQHARMHALWADAGYASDRDGRIQFTSQIIGREITSSSELTGDEADKVIGHLQRYIRQDTPPEDQDGGAAA